MPAELAAEAFHFILLFCRLGAAGLLLPGLGEQDIPASIRLALGLSLPVLLLPALSSDLPVAPVGVPDLLRLLGSEILIGLWLGLLARLVALALTQAGQMVALMIGLASPLQTDPSIGAQTTAPARLFGLLAAVLMLSTGLYAVPLRALAQSYALLPPGAPLPLDASAATLAAAVAESLTLALRLVAPLLLSAVVSSLALALLARVAPQLPAYTIAAPGQILLGLMLLVLVLPAMLPVWLSAAGESFAHLAGQP
jgi:flagellar biosynthetic protein FliR